MPDWTISEWADGAAIAQAVLAIAALLFIARQVKLATRDVAITAEAARREAVEDVMKLWYSLEMSESRRYLNGTFQAVRWPGLLQKWPLTVRQAIGELPPDERPQLGRMLSFFDRVGWLSAEEIFQVDWFILPMRHVAMRIYLLMLPFIVATRFGQGEGHDPTYGGGLDALFAASLHVDQAAAASEKVDRLGVPERAYRPADITDWVSEDCRRIINTQLGLLKESGKRQLEPVLTAWRLPFYQPQSD